MKITTFMLVKTRLMEPQQTIDYKKLYEQGQLEIIQLRKEFASLRQVNEQLLHRLDLLLKTHFGSKSERYSPKEQVPGQLSLELQKEETVTVSLESGTEKISGPKPQKAKPAAAKKKRTDNM